MDIPYNAHVLVMDGHKLLLFKNVGSLVAPTLSVVTHRECASAATQDQGSDMPGTMHQSVGSARSGYEQPRRWALDSHDAGRPRRRSEPGV